MGRIHFLAELLKLVGLIFIFPPFKCKVDVGTCHRVAEVAVQGDALVGGKWSYFWQHCVARAAGNLLMWLSAC